MRYLKNAILIVFSIFCLLRVGSITMAEQGYFAADKRNLVTQNSMVDSPNRKFRAIANFHEQTINIFEVEWQVGSGSLKIGVS
jgi:hypothetical protein